MKKKYLFIGVGVVLFGVIVLSILSLIKSFNKDKQEMLESGNLIKEAYDNVKKEVENYNNIRIDIAKLTDNFYYSTIVDVYDDNLEKFNTYDSIINDITKQITVIDSKCGQLYNEKEVNDICNIYKKDYETIVNVFINDINSYNNKLSSYNDDEEGNLELFKSNYISDYVDYNGDGIYLKKDGINE